VRSHDISAAGREASSVDYDPTTDRFYVTDYTDGSDILRFRTEWIPDGSLSLSQDVPKIQGISFHKGKMYLTSDTADDLYEVDLGGTVTPTPLYRSKFGGNFEGITSDGNTLYVLIDSTVSAVFKLVPSATSDLLELGGGEFLQVPNIPAQETWTFSITGSTHLFTRNNALASLNSTNSDRATAVMRESSNPSEWSAWDNENGWMGPSQGQSVALLDPHRIALAYDGTSGRKISLDGLPYAAQSGIQARPGGTEHTWYIGAGNDTGKEFLTGAVSFAFLFGGYASDARLAAEYATLHDTRNFYLPL